MSWILLILAGCFEVVGVIGINQVNDSPRIRSYVILICGFLFSFFLLTLSMKNIAMGTAYAVWTGIGTIGSTLVGMLFYGEPKDIRRILFISLIIVSVLGLKLIS